MNPYTREIRNDTSLNFNWFLNLLLIITTFIRVQFDFSSSHRNRESLEVLHYLNIDSYIYYILYAVHYHDPLPRSQQTFELLFKSIEYFHVEQYGRAM